MPDAKLCDGVFAKSMPLEAPENKDVTFSVFGWTPIYWDFDFGRVQPISAIRLHSNRPDYACEGILVLGSRDGEQWFKITDLATPGHKSIQDNGRLAYSDDNIQTSAKLLKVVLMRRRLPTTLFFDEMEVVKAAEEWRPEQYVETQVKSVQTAVEDALTEIGARNRLHDDAAALRRILADSPALLKKLDGIEERFSSLKAPDTVLFSSSFPQNPLHEELFALYAEHLRSKGTAKFSVWSPYRYAFPNVFEEPKNDLKSLQFNMLRNTKHSVLVQMLNSMDRVMMPDCSFEGPENVLKALELSVLPWTD
ncbi:MAG: hypothetical protein J5833_04480, partial [Victivallales bacterium]|nr:hypothetical protein [Victivallales bacterium]